MSNQKKFLPLKLPQSDFFSSHHSNFDRVKLGSLCVSLDSFAAVKVRDIGAVIKVALERHRRSVSSLRVWFLNMVTLVGNPVWSSNFDCFHHMDGSPRSVHRTFSLYSHLKSFLLPCWLPPAGSVVPQLSKCLWTVKLLTLTAAHTLYNTVAVCHLAHCTQRRLMCFLKC